MRLTAVDMTSPKGGFKECELDKCIKEVGSNSKGDMRVNFLTNPNRFFNIILKKCKLSYLWNILYKKKKGGGLNERNFL